MYSRPSPRSALPPPYVRGCTMPAELINPPEGQACPAAHWGLAVACLAVGTALQGGHVLMSGKESLVVESKVGLRVGSEVWPKLTAPSKPLPSPPHPQTRGRDIHRRAFLGWLAG